MRCEALVSHTPTPSRHCALTGHFPGLSTLSGSPGRPTAKAKPSEHGPPPPQQVDEAVLGYPDLKPEFPGHSSCPEHSSYDLSLPEWGTHYLGQQLETAAKALAVGILLFLLIAFLCCCCCCCGRSSSRRREKVARREERHRRRALRRAARKQAIKSWLSRHLLRRSQAELDEEELKRNMLASQREEIQDDQEDIVGSEISEFRNAASMISDMVVAAEEGRFSTDSRASLPDYVSQVGGERLPVYRDVDADESGLASVVADGFRYTPGNSEYDPGNSRAGAGGVRDVLGDSKD